MILIENISQEKLSQVLAEGVDERIFRDKEGKIKYGVDLTNSTIVNRGSCTCNPATPDNVKIISKMLETHEGCEWTQLKREQVKQLKAYINLENQDIFDVLFAPSGTDLSYFPLLVSKLLHPERPILNIITCAEELGSGTLLAAQGKYHADYNQFGDHIEKEKQFISDDSIKTFVLQARSEDGEIYNPEAAVIEQVEKYPDHSIIINLVMGSKSGIEDNLDIIDNVPSDQIIWNVDLCQFRHDREIINRLLQKNVMVMITGSKFYQSPPFCGATLLPRSIRECFNEDTQWDQLSIFKKIFTKHDLPPFMHYNNELPDTMNISGILRWQCAIEELNKYNAIPLEKRKNKIKEWNAFVISELAQRPEIKLMPDQALTNKTIISFRVKKEGQFLNHESNKKLYRSIIDADYSSNYPFKNILIGQPVSYGNKSFLRFAIGAKGIRQLIKDKDTDFNLDKAIIDIIVEKIKAFNAD